MKKLFTAIRQNDLETVKEIIEKKPELVNCVAKQPPKKDDGQSPLQVALKTEAFEIASYLIDNGANVNFIESEDCANLWRAPVIHDAINAAIMCSRYNCYEEIDEFDDDFDFDDDDDFDDEENEYTLPLTNIKAFNDCIVITNKNKLELYVDQTEKSPMFKEVINEEARHCGLICDAELQNNGTILNFITNKNINLKPCHQVSL